MPKMWLPSLVHPHLCREAAGRLLAPRRSPAGAETGAASAATPFLWVSVRDERQCVNSGWGK